jgi:hypothetical protein
MDDMDPNNNQSIESDEEPLIRRRFKIIHYDPAQIDKTSINMYNDTITNKNDDELPSLVTNENDDELPSLVTNENDVFESRESLTNWVYKIHQAVNNKLNVDLDVMEEKIVIDEVDDHKIINDTESTYIYDTNGLDHQIVKTLNDGYELVCCEMCNLYYEDQLTCFDNDGQHICYHCLFYLNYDPDMRPFVDGVYGMTIMDYVTKLSPLHDKQNCMRHGNNCFLCDALNGLPLENVLITNGHTTTEPRQKTMDEIDESDIVVELEL